MRAARHIARHALAAPLAPVIDARNARALLRARPSASPPWAGPPPSPPHGGIGQAAAVSLNSPRGGNGRTPHRPPARGDRPGRGREPEFRQVGGER